MAAVISKAMPRRGFRGKRLMTKDKTPLTSLDLSEPTAASPKAIPRTQGPRLGRPGIAGGASSLD
jgi:hypothetical protein